GHAGYDDRRHGAQSAPPALPQRPCPPAADGNPQRRGFRTAGTQRRTGSAGSCCYSPAGGGGVAGVCQAVSDCLGPVIARRFRNRFTGKRTSCPETAIDSARPAIPLAWTPPAIPPYSTAACATGYGL